MHRLAPLISLLVLSTAPARAQWSTDFLSQARRSVEAVTVGDLVLFAGGNVANSDYDRVDIYDAATDTWSSASLSVSRSFLAANPAAALTPQPTSIPCTLGCSPSTSSPGGSVPEGKARGWSRPRSPPPRPARLQHPPTTEEGRRSFSRGRSNG